MRTRLAKREQGQKKQRDREWDLKMWYLYLWPREWSRCPAELNIRDANCERLVTVRRTDRRRGVTSSQWRFKRKSSLDRTDVISIGSSGAGAKWISGRPEIGYDRNENIVGWCLRRRPALSHLPLRDSPLHQSVQCLPRLCMSSYTAPHRRTHTLDRTEIPRHRPLQHRVNIASSLPISHPSRR